MTESDTLHSRLRQAKTRKGKKFLEDRAPKLIENDKQAILIRGNKTSETINQLLKDLYSLHKPLATLLKKKNAFYPFDDETTIERFCRKYDHSLFAFGNHCKRRPHNLILGRLFDDHILDMVEFGVENFRSANHFKNYSCPLGTKPCLLFQGDEFAQDDYYIRVLNVFKDFFRGPKVDALRLQGVELAHVFTLVDSKIQFRTYRVLLKNSGTAVPTAELVEVGPCFDLVPRRKKLASHDLFKLACKQPRAAKVGKTKNVTQDVFGSKLGRLHVGKQDLSRLQTRKVKALKHSLVETGNDGEENNDETVDKRSRIDLQDNGA